MWHVHCMLMSLFYPPDVGHYIIKGLCKKPCIAFSRRGKSLLSSLTRTENSSITSCRPNCQCLRSKAIVEEKNVDKLEHVAELFG